MKKHIVVIGGGMAGTAAAYNLTKQGYDVTIVEKNNRLGGRIHSITVDNATFEVGAGFVTDSYTNIFAFLKETDLAIYLQKRKSKAAIVKNGKLQWASSRSTIFGNALLSSYAKRQLINELVKLLPAFRFFDIHTMGKAYVCDNKSISEALKNKKDAELIDYLIQPVLDSYCYWSAERTSYAMLLFLARLLVVPHRTYTLQCGLQRIPETAAKGSTVLLAHEVTHVSKLSDNEYEVVIKNNHDTKKLRAHGIVCAIPATAVLNSIKNLQVNQKKFFSSIHYSSTVVVTKTYRPKITPANYAIAYPRCENDRLGTMTVVSDTSSGKTKKATLVKLFASGVSGKKLCEKKDDDIDSILSRKATLSNKVFDSSGKPIFRYVQRWMEAIPEFTVGHFRRLHAFTKGEIESENDTIVFAGDYIGGPFIEGAFTSGVQAALRLHNKLQK